MWEDMRKPQSDSEAGAGTDVQRKFFRQGVSLLPFPHATSCHDFHGSPRTKKGGPSLHPP